MRTSRVLVAATAVALAAALAACDTQAQAGTAEPYPSECVEEVRESFLAEDADWPGERPVDDPEQLLLHDRLMYRISGEDYLRYAVRRYTEPDKVPQEYRFPEQPELAGTDPLTFVFFSAMWEAECLPEGAADAIVAELLAPPEQ